MGVAEAINALQCAGIRPGFMESHGEELTYF